MSRRRGFTFIEVLAIAALIGTGLVALVAVILYALSRALLAQAACTAMPTAISLAADPSPLLPVETAGDWTQATIDADLMAGASATTSGWMNGYWVVRQEESAREDVLGARSPSGMAWSVVPGHLRSVRVTVRVYEGGAKGRQVGFFTTRILRQKP